MLVLCLLLVCACARNRDLPAGSIALVDKGNSRCAVVIGDKASVVEKHAAEELCLFLGKVTGARVAQSNAPQADKYSIWLGTPETCPAIAKLGALKDVQSLSDQGVLIRSDERGLLIAGKTPLGVLYGVYAFLEEHVGMRWFFPGEDGEYCPKTPTLKIRRINNRQNPSFKQRSMGYCNTATTAKTTNSWDWCARNRVKPCSMRSGREEVEKRGRYTVHGGSDNVMLKMVPDSLFEAHPEYFALIDGKRCRQSQDKRVRFQPCTSNPEVIDLATKYVLDFFRKFPDGQFQIANNDCGGWCQCEKCLVLDPPDERRKGAVATRFAVFENEIANRVFSEFPDADLYGRAYQNFRIPPTGVRFDPRLKFVFFDHDRCYRHSLGDTNCPANQWFRDMLEGWAKVVSSMQLATYYVIYAGEQNERTAGILCAPLEYIVAGDMRYSHRLGHTAWGIGTIPPDGNYRHSNGLYDSPRNWDFWRANMAMHYVQAKLAWNINADVDALLKDLNDKYYGPASGAMGRYQALARKLWDETPGDFIYGSSYGAIGKSVESPSAIKALSDMLDEAEKAATGDPVVLKRIAKDKEIFKEGWLKAREQYIKRQANDVHAARITAPVTLDGKLDEVDWGLCERATGFIRSNGAVAEAQTSVRLLYDNENLYAGLEMDEPLPGKLMAKTRERDDNKIWDGNTVELFIDPAGDGKRYVHMAINFAGALRDSECKPGAPTIGAVNFNTDAQVAALAGTNQWTVEMKVSAKSLGGNIADGGRWLMNVGRSRNAGKAEISSWMDGSFHDISSFRGVTFAGPIIANGGFEETITLDNEALLKKHKSGTWKFGNQPPIVPKDWKLHYAGGRMATILSEGAYAGKNSLQIDGGVILNSMKVAMKPGDTFEISFAARGLGKIEVSLYHYNTAKLFKVTKLGEADLNLTPASQWKRYEFIHTLPVDYPPVATLALGVTDRAEIDDVRAVPVKASGQSRARPDGTNIVNGFRVFIHESGTNGTLPCRLFIPENIREGEKYPLIVYFHGSGSAGNDNLAQLNYAKVYADREIQSKYPCFIVAPQIPENHRWVDTDCGKTEHIQPAITREMKMTLEIIDRIVAEYPIDNARIYVNGQSLGGYAVFDIICRRPDMFAAAVPLCGGGDVTRAASIKDIPIWAFHGALDTSVPVINSRNMIAAIKKAGGSPRYTEWENVKHDAWNHAYKEPGLTEWIFGQKRK